MSVTGAKAEARKVAYARRKVAHGRGEDVAAQAHLAAFLAPYRGQPLAGYMPIRTEIDPIPVMAAWDGPVGVPVILGPGQPLAFQAWAPGCAMVEGPFGAFVPEDGAVIVPHVLIVPLVAFDATGGRLGYGGGFYDRTLERLRAAGPTVAVGFAYGAQQAEALPREPTDQRLDAIVTETGAHRF